MVGVEVMAAEENVCTTMVSYFREVELTQLSLELALLFGQYYSQLSLLCLQSRMRLHVISCG